MSDLHDQPDGTPDLAAEYAVGVLGGADRRMAERRMREDAAFAADVHWWENRFAPLFREIRSVNAPAIVWDRISEDIDRIARVGAAYRNHVQSPKAARKATKGLGGVSPIWRTLAGASTLLAVASLAALATLVPATGLKTLGTPGETTLTARLASSTGETFFTVVVDLQSQTATLIPVAGVADQSRVPELWLIEETAPAPRSLGLIEAEQPLKLRLRDLGADASDATLAVSLEPEGGSPTGAPTGPVVATGALDRI
ncbi:anti-sigma factor [Fulvimarina sp. 2208YS6-2-32]|uniref:Anti-sigma factor n=1 Tax=Fulvimarina uroteuthidis TaxID=3098149 RepID=A0ABU5HZM1_9HYPH|nr:anti-sigma factor [Fulvimarina sp. 2208YS6-2-32]MDY8108583.1 anti-sigma factor [Fulvimarina sp. 2208YS6-2-32]